MCVWVCVARKEGKCSVVERVGGGRERKYIIVRTVEMKRGDNEL